jgi:hypothetical protein
MTRAGHSITFHLKTLDRTSPRSARCRPGPCLPR